MRSVEIVQEPAALRPVGAELRVVLFFCTLGIIASALALLPLRDSAAQLMAYALLAA
jgi:hypothetical protein